MSRIWRGLTKRRAETDPHSPDRRLRGRTYAISFDRVWTASLALAEGGMRGWRVRHADDQRGVIIAVTRTLFLRRVDDIRIEIRLDENAQTRVDLISQCRKGKRDLGRNARRVGRFLRRLDTSLEATAAQILDATIQPPWIQPA